MIETFIKRPVFTTMLIMVLVVFGIQSYPRLGLDLYPDVELPLVSVTVTYEGTAPEEMETLVTKPIENRVSRVAGIKSITSTVREGYSQTVLEFEMDADPLQMAGEVREKVASARKWLPDDIDEPVVARVAFGARPVGIYTFSSAQRSTGELHRLLKETVSDELQRIEGVADVFWFGGSERAIKIHVDPAKLALYGLSFQTVREKINSANQNTPGGRTYDDNYMLTIRTIGKFTSLEDFQRIVVANVGGRPILLTDIAEVVDGWEDEASFARTNGIPAVVLEVRKQSRANTVAVVDAVNVRLEELMREELPPDVKAESLMDQSRYVRSNINDVWMTVLFGGFLALGITYLFLRDLRATLIGGLAIPTSIVAAFFLMRSLDFTLNNMSLMGLSLAVGFLIDDAIVLVENIFRHIEHGKAPSAAAADATKELALAIFATSMSLLAVFVPLGNMGEVVGQYFKQFALTVAFALTFSTFSAYSLTPMVAAHWLAPAAATTRPRFVTRLLDAFNARVEAFRVEYRGAMAVALRQPRRIVAGAIALFLLQLPLLPFLGAELQPVYDSGEFRVTFKAPAGTGLEQMKTWVKPLEDAILALPEVEVAAMHLGGARTSIHEGNIRVRLKPREERSRGMLAVMSELRRKFSSVSNMQVSLLTNQGTGGDPRPVQIGLRGNDLHKLADYADALAEMIRRTPGATDVEVVGIVPEPEILVRVDPYRASQFGLDSTGVGKVVQYAFQGRGVGRSYTIGNSDYDIILQLEQVQRRTLQDVADLMVSTPVGKFVRLGDVAEVTIAEGPTRISREGRQRQIAVYANTVGISPGDLLQVARQELIPALNLEVGYRYKFIGGSDIMVRVFREIAQAVGLAVILIYMVLAAEFESFSQPLVIMISLPFALIGAVLSLLVMNQTANMMALIGFTMLLGLVTKNAILIVDYANQARARGMALREAVLEACSLRLRPILMTTFSTLLGMMPVALGFGAGAELRQAMGLVLVGGLTTSTLLTLIVVPLLYVMTEEWKAKRRRS